MATHTVGRTRPKTDRTDACPHFNALASGFTEARQVRDAWVYSTPYRCLDCGLHFSELHAQSVRRDSENAVG